MSELDLAPSRTSSDPAPPFGRFAPTRLQNALSALATATPLGRGDARWWVSSMIERIRPGPIDVERLGLKLRLHHYGGNYSEKKLLLHAHHYDRREIAHIVRTARPGFQFADIGAHAGFYSYAVKSHCPQARIVAFEPNPMLAERIRFNVSTNALSDFHLVEAAVGSEAGRAKLFEKQGGLHGDGPGEEVDVVPLYETLVGKGLTGLDAMKIDIEGFEDRVLFPFFEQTPREWHPATVVIEHCFHDLWERDCRVLLAEHGYRAVWSGALNTVYERAN